MVDWLFSGLLGRFDSYEELVPFVMLACGRGTAAGKGAVQDLNIRD